MSEVEWVKRPPMEIEVPEGYIVNDNEAEHWRGLYLKEHEELEYCRQQNASLRAQLAEARAALNECRAHQAYGVMEQEALKTEADLKLNAGMLARQCDLARQAEAERDQWKQIAEQYKINSGICEEGMIAALARAKAAEAGICQPGCETLVAVETERNAAEAHRDTALARAEAAESVAGVMRQALIGADWIIKKLAPHEGLAIAVRGYVPDPDDVATGAKYRAMIDAALSHPEAQSERVRLEALASAARKVLAVCGVPVLQAMPQSSIELLQELREALDATGKEAKGDD